MGRFMRVFRHFALELTLFLFLHFLHLLVGIRKPWVNTVLVKVFL